jgi:hypothetical protein
MRGGHTLHFEDQEQQREITEIREDIKAHSGPWIIP